MRIEPDDLVALGRDVAPPFEIALTGGVCVLNKIHRLLPSKRLAGRGVYQGREIFVKLFFGKGARRAFSRDKRGTAILHHCGVHTPRLLLETTTARRGGYALLFNYMQNAQPLASSLSGTPSTLPADGNEDMAFPAALAVEALAQLHGHGAVHSDPNLDNFLMSDGRLYLVDGAAIRRTGAALRETSSLKALAAFLAEYPPAADEHAPKLLAHYAAERGWPETSGHRTQSSAQHGSGATPINKVAPVVTRINRLQTELIAARRHRIRRYLTKTERSCTEFRRESSRRKVILAKRSDWNSALAEFANDPQAGLNKAEIIKNGRSATVYRLGVGGKKVVVKRYNVKSSSQRIRRWFKPRPRIAWRNGHRLAFLDIPCAEPIALIERRWGPLRAESWLVMPDHGPLNIQTEVETRGWSEPLLKRVVRLFQVLKIAGLQHRDTKASNFLLQGDKVYLIDYDSLRQHPGSALDIARFLENFDGEAHAQVMKRFEAAGL